MCVCVCVHVGVCVCVILTLTKLSSSLYRMLYTLQISSLKAELGRPSEMPRLPPPLPIESTSKVVKDISTEKKTDEEEDDAFEEGEPSPPAPCPYLSFVPLQDDPRARRKKGKDSKPSS